MEVVDVPHGGVHTASTMSGFEFTPEPECLYVTVRALTADVPNLNHDMFPDEDLQETYKTFLGSGVFLNHKNKDVTRARGVIIGAKYHVEESDDRWVEILMKMDERNYPKLCEKIRSGELDTCSMGINIDYSICSRCGNVAITEHDFCNHVRNKGRGQYADVYEICKGGEFFEESYVWTPADETALTMLLFEGEDVKAAVHVGKNDDLFL